MPGGGVNWPIATMKVSSTPHQTGSQPNSFIIGMSRGTKMRKMEMPSSTIPMKSDIPELAPADGPIDHHTDEDAVGDRHHRGFGGREPA
jgi:hypothetical protein